MKKALSMILASLTAALALAACGGTPSSSQGDASSSAPSSTSTPSSSATSDASSAASSSASVPASSTSANTSDEIDPYLEEIIGRYVEAAGLGATIPVTQMDLTAMYGLTMDNIDGFAGYRSKTVAQTGAEVLLLQAKPDTAAAIVAELEAYRDAIVADERYAEFADARENVKNARIEVMEDNVVIYAVSATGTEGGYGSLDEAIEAPVGGEE